MYNYKNLEHNKAAILPLSILSTFLIMDTKSPLNTTSYGNHYIYVINDRFSNYIVLVSTPRSNAQYAVKTKFHYCISKNGPPQDLITDEGTDYLNS